MTEVLPDRHKFAKCTTDGPLPFRDAAWESRDAPEGNSDKILVRKSFKAGNCGLELILIACLLV